MLDDIVIDSRVIKRSLEKSQAVVAEILSNKSIHQDISEAAKRVCGCLKGGKKLLFAGNGGSAADAQHMSAEYVSRFMFDRPGLPAIALTTDTSALTAIGNDYGFENLFSRQVQALGHAGDVFFAYSTSGTSPNIIKGLEEAKRKGIVCIGMMGNKPQSEKMASLCDVCIRIPSVETPYIQEGHLVVGHLICLVVEQLLFSAN